MKTPLEIDSDMAAKLRSIATAKNISIEALLNACVPGLISDSNSSRVGPEAALRELDKWITEFPDTELLSDDAISRTTMYCDRSQV